VLRADNRATLRPIRIGHVADEQWLVLDGLTPGDRVIVEGFQKFTAGDIVDPVSWETRARSASAAVETLPRGTD
jgi:membrane fusion protein, multidrug efflux system